MLQSARAAMEAEAFDYTESHGNFAEVLQPTVWTPEAVGQRMIEAASVLRRTGGSVGPKAYGSNWPSILRSKADRNDVQADESHKAEVVATTLRQADRPTIDEIGRMEEAVRWPALYLKRAIDADAVTLWATCLAHNRPIRDIMATRGSRATLKAMEAQKEKNHALAEKRRAAARRVAAWANERLLGADPERAGRIRANAHLRIERECKKLKAVRVHPSSMSPDATISERSLNRYLHAALKVIAERLTAAGVRYRPVPVPADDAHKGVPELNVG